MTNVTYCTIFNCVVITVFAVLAWTFGKWWIILLAWTYMVHPTTEGKQ